MKKAIVAVFIGNIHYSNLYINVSDFYSENGFEDYLTPRDKREVKDEDHAILEQVRKHVEGATSFRVDFIVDGHRYRQTYFTEQRA